jgi:hypothetical protein
VTGWRRFAYVELVNAGHLPAPAPPGGLRPGQIGLLMIGRVLLGDIAATLADLAVRGLLGLTGPIGAASGGWLLTARLDASPPGLAGTLLGYERVLLRGLADLGSPVSLQAVGRDVLDQTRRELVHDAIGRGWLHPTLRYTHGAEAADLARRILAFQRDLRQLRSQPGAGPLAAQLLPYALQFQLAGSEDPVARFAYAFCDTFTGLLGWHLPAPERVDFAPGEDLDVWITGW